jgi:hypothetical protein
MKVNRERVKDVLVVGIALVGAGAILFFGFMFS